MIVILLIVVVRSAGGQPARQNHWRSNGHLGQHVQALNQGQEQLRGGLQTVSDTQANAQAQVIQTVESRLASVQQQMNDRLADNAVRSQRTLAEMQERMRETLQGSSKQTTTSLTQLQERLAAIDKAQDNITKAQRRCAEPSGYPVEQANARGVWGNPAERHRVQGTAQ